MAFLSGQSTRHLIKPAGGQEGKIDREIARDLLQT